MPTRRVQIVVREIVEHEIVADVEIDDDYLESCESDDAELVSYLDQDWSLWNDALRWETCSIVENDIESAEVVDPSTPLSE